MSFIAKAMKTKLICLMVLLLSNSVAAQNFILAANTEPQPVKTAPRKVEMKLTGNEVSRIILDQQLIFKLAGFSDPAAEVTVQDTAMRADRRIQFIAAADLEAYLPELEGLTDRIYDAEEHVLNPISLDSLTTPAGAVVAFEVDWWNAQIEKADATNVMKLRLVTPVEPTECKELEDGSSSVVSCGRSVLLLRNRYYEGEERWNYLYVPMGELPLRNDSLDLQKIIGGFVGIDLRGEMAAPGLLLLGLRAGGVNMQNQSVNPKNEATDTFGVWEGFNWVLTQAALTLQPWNRQVTEKLIDLRLTLENLGASS